MPDFTGSLIDHLNVAVPDLAASLAFYEPVLETLGIVKLLHVPANPADDQLEMYGFGAGHKPFFWLTEQGRVGDDMHLAFVAPDRAGVRAFYETALAHGARTLYPPAVHPEYQPDYYGAFVLDVNGINLEAVCHRPE
jgi:catechol 2,3-dioxygenase-like lactoylglutathione lyase family enzyme